MADYCTHASIALLVTNQEGALLQQLFDWLDQSIEADEISSLPADVRAVLEIPEDADNLKCVAALFSDPDNPFLAPHYTLSVEDAEHMRLEIWGDQVEPESIWKIIFHLAKSALPFAFEWASTCSRYRPDSFGGGYVAIFPDRVEVRSTRESMARALADDREPNTSAPLVVTVPGFAVFNARNLPHASQKYAQLRDESGLGASEFPNGSVAHDGFIIASISYNGRIFEPSYHATASPVLCRNRPHEAAAAIPARETPHV